jgi:hypothetical protein
VYAHGSFSWEEVEAALGFGLPQDYKDLIGTYGYGKFGDYLSFYSPFEHDSVEEFIKAISMFSDLQHQSRTTNPEWTLPFSFYPYEPFVILAFTDDTGHVSWLDNGGAEFLVTTDADFSPAFGHYKKSWSQFIYEWVTGSFLPYGFDNAEVIPDKATFVQW